MLAQIANFVKTNEHLVAPADGNLNVKIFNRRKEYIKVLRASAEKIAESLRAAESRHEQDIETANSLVSQAQPAAQPVPTPSAASQPAISAQLPPVECATRAAEWQQVGRKSPKSTVAPVNLAGTLLTAVHVQEFADVKRDGRLYYVAPNDHFAINIDGNLFHGNVGRIFSGIERAVKIKDCMYTHNCAKNSACDFYHDPAIFAGSTDHRNYVATSWLYSQPQNRTGVHRNMRHIGDIDNLPEDLAASTEEEVSRLRDQVMHDMICAIAAIAEQKKRSSSF